MTRIGLSATPELFERLFTEGQLEELRSLGELHLHLDPAHLATELAGSTLDVVVTTWATPPVREWTDGRTPKLLAHTGGTVRPLFGDDGVPAGCVVVQASAAMADGVAEIPDATRDRVLAVAEALGYAPDRAACSLRRRSTEQICLVIGGFDVYREPESGAMAEAVAHLWATGRRRIAYIGRQRETEQFHAGEHVEGERLVALEAAVRAHGGRMEPGLVVAGADDRAQGYRAASALLCATEPPDAIVSGSSRSAVSAIWAARDHGCSIPEDAAVLGAGTIPEAQVTRPALSTIGPPTDADFDDLAALLFDRLTEHRSAPWRQVARPWTYTRRGST